MIASAGDALYILSALQWARNGEGLMEAVDPKFRTIQKQILLLRGYYRCGKAQLLHSSCALLLYGAFFAVSAYNGSITQLQINCDPCSYLHMLSFPICHRELRT